MSNIDTLEAKLNDFNQTTRSEALEELIKLSETGEINTAQETDAHNLHCHTFFSYNGYGYSPSYITWLAKKSGWLIAGSVDFDVLDAVDEFRSTGQKLNIRTSSGIETRVFIPEFEDREINSPGEPGVAYHMGVGFTTGDVPAEAKPFLKQLKEKANNRTKDIVSRVNAFLETVQLDFDADVLPLTPSGNATERHVCEAYQVKAEAVLQNQDERAAFWSDKLSTPLETMKDILNDSVKLQATIRSKTMKSGGAGYVKPDPSSFPLLKEMNDFTKACGALPSLAWLNGESAGEDSLEELLDLHIANGMAAVNFVPDRNWNFSDPEVKQAKVTQLNRFMEAAKARDLPVMVGTEMNAPGLKLVDDFESDALAPHLDEFVKGALIGYAHTLLQPLGMGYLTEWASQNFDNTKSKNEFYADFGKKFLPSVFEQAKSDINSSMTPETVLSV